MFIYAVSVPRATRTAADANGGCNEEQPLTGADSPGRAHRPCCTSIASSSTRYMATHHDGYKDGPACEGKYSAVFGQEAMARWQGSMRHCGMNALEGLLARIPTPMQGKLSMSVPATTIGWREYNRESRYARVSDLATSLMESCEVRSILSSTG